MFSQSYLLFAVLILACLLLLVDADVMAKAVIEATKCPEGFKPLKIDNNVICIKKN